ncbi:YibE/F family protein [Oscillibacter sp. MSJ-2]|uniref:YibE/F family protein n=1 Tax=Dysosmobacter acutus TaxID=2841504 RepID=A0ABS6F8Q4_9FIRM|nr:YibE/F family protein [Dysosmobacter acutus]MBU5626656.1 YibE/F family protein [Dysosmobacter acutus]
MQKKAVKIERRNAVVTVAVLAVLTSLVVGMHLTAPEKYVMYSSESITYEQGRVTAVLSERLEEAPGMPGWKLGEQEIRVEFMSGAWKGQEVQLTNNLSTTHNIHVRVGQRVIVKADCPEHVEPYYTLYNYDRAPGLMAVGLIFVAMMALVGRGKGLKSVLGLGISLFFILGFLLPAIYRGWSPVMTASLTVVVIAAFSLILLNGFSRKTATAVTATAAGVVFSAGFFLLLSALLSLSGYNQPEAEELILISQHTGLRIGEVLFAGVLISSLGAVMDTTMSIASSLHELHEVHPDRKGWDLFRSGIVIGRDMIGTMCQTLVLAFVGSSIASLLVLCSYGTRLDQFLSSDYAAIEVVHAVSGSLAVIVSVPVTAFLCALDSSRTNIVKEKGQKKR